MAATMADDDQPLTTLLAELVGDGRPMTYRAFHALAIDPTTGYQPSPSTIWKITKGEEIKANPQLFRAIAAGLGMKPEQILHLAARQYVGYEVSDPFARSTEGGVQEGVVHSPGMAAEDMPKNRTISDRWDAEGA